MKTSRTTLLALAVPLLLATVGAFSLAAHPKPQHRIQPDVADSNNRVTLPSGWRVTPVGHTLLLPGDMPTGMVVTPDGKYLLLNSAGFHDHTVSAVDLTTETVTQSVDVHKDWGSLAIDAEGDDVYMAGASASDASYTASLSKQGLPAATAAALSRPVYRLAFRDGKLTIAGGIDVEGMEKGHFAATVASGPDEALFVLDINGDTVYKLAGKPRKVTAKARVGYRPCSAVVSPNGKSLAIANGGDQSISLLDTDTLKEQNRIHVGSQPEALKFSADGRLFVACAGENRVAVLRDGTVLESIDVALEPDAPIGTTPAALALSPNGKTLFVACAGNNDVAVVDISHPGHSEVQGFLPTGWYPSALAVSPDGKKLYIGVGKGLGFRKNYPAQTAQPTTSVDGKVHYDYIGTVLSGALSIVKVPDARHLAIYTKQVRANMPLPDHASIRPAQLASITHNVFPHIKHVLYIIRENRTYDQVFGDIPTGNGDPNLTMYGEQITPNAHALAHRTVLLDNLYCSGEVSEDGHQWCNAAYATDFREKGWINSYSGRGEPDDDGRLGNSPAGYLWDSCARHGLTFRSYGEFTGFTSTPTTKPVYTGHPTLNGHACLAWWQLDSKKDARDYDYAQVFIDELKEAEKTGDWPRYMVMSLGEDHTDGLRADSFTPFSCVAANDVGLGKIVEAISHSRFWPETAIFVIEDDAQDGPDHVDAHRTEGLLISPYVKRGSVDSTLYTTASMLHTIELILGLPPMTQFDAHATPMVNCFTTKPDLTPYDCLPARIDLAARNPKQGLAAQQSANLDFSSYDRADPVVLNRLLWENARPGVPMPAPVHSGILTR